MKDIEPDKLKEVVPGCSMSHPCFFSLLNLKEVGFTPKELYADGQGFSVDELKCAGLTAKQLRVAGIPADLLIHAEYYSCMDRACKFGPVTELKNEMKLNKLNEYLISKGISLCGY